MDFFGKEIELTLQNEAVDDTVSMNLNVNDTRPGYGALAFTVPEWARPTGAISSARATFVFVGSSSGNSVDLDYKDGSFYLGHITNSSSDDYSVARFTNLFITYQCSSQPAVTGEEPVSLSILRQCI